MISPRQDMTRDLVEQLTKAARSRPARASQSEAVEFPFDRPNRFDRSQLIKLGESAGRIADCASQKARQMLQMSVDFLPAEWEQHYAGALRQTFGKDLRYIVPISVEGGDVVGMIGMSAATAAQWLAKLLGGCGPNEGDDDGDARELSALERDLLLDIATGFVEALRTATGSLGSAAFQATRELGAWPEAFGAEDAAEYCLLEFAAEQPGQGNLVIMLTGPTAALLAGESAPRASRAAASAAMRGHVDQMPVEARAMLSASLSVREVMSLSPGDVVVLNQPIDEPLDLEVDGKLVLRGHPARQDGQFALQFAEFCPIQKQKKKK